MTEKVKANRKAWVIGLRSGEYKQARSQLNNHRGHCCLGVACEVMAKRGVKVGRTPEGYVTGEFILNNEESGHFPNEHSAVAKAIGITLEEQRDLARANDCGECFADIANMIEGRTK